MTAAITNNAPGMNGGVEATVQGASPDGLPAAEDTTSLPFTIGKGHGAEIQNTPMPWETIVMMLSMAATDETIALADYLPLSSKERLPYKSRAGHFLLAETKGGHRNDASIVSRSGGQVDIDDGDPSPGQILACVPGIECALLSTRSSAPGDARWRLIVPFANPIQPHQFKAAMQGLIGRFKQAGLVVDEGASTKLSQPAFFPTVCRDQTYYFQHQRGDMFVPDTSVRPDAPPGVSDAWVETAKAHDRDTPLSDEAREHLRAALRTIPSDDYHNWARVGLALKTIPDDEDGFALFNEWSKSWDEYPGEDEVRRKWTKDFKDSTKTHWRAIFKLASDSYGWVNPGPAHAAAVAGGEAAPITDDATHHDIAGDYVANLSTPPPVGAEGSLWTYQGGLWQRQELNKAQVAIAGRYTGKLCKRKGDYRAIAEHAYDMMSDDEFFTEAPVGLATPAGFYRVSDNVVTCEPLAPELAQRFMVDVTPAPGAMPIFWGFLCETFANADPGVTQQQIQLLQEVMGSILVGCMYKFEKVVMLYGSGQAGKSTVMRILGSLIHDQFTCAHSPFEWDKEYSVAAMAGKRLNMVGELPNDKHIPAEKFKQITGRDKVSGRFPYGRPFEFYVTAAHLFNTNHFINTRDNSAGFWRRWLILGFDNPVSDNRVDRDLDTKIIDGELPAVLHWGLQGASRVIGQGGFSASKRHDVLFQKWRISADSVAAYVNDPDAVMRVVGTRIVRSAAYDHFRRWCITTGRKQMANQTFYKRIEELNFRISKNQGIFVIYDLQITNPFEGQ